MKLVRLCLARPVGVSVGVLLVMLAGLLALLAIPIQLTPNVDVPIINVRTVWAGANAQEIEREIIDRQEEQLRSVKGLREMTSMSLDNWGRITLEFYTGVDKSEALRDVTDKLRQVTGYPLDMEEPTVVAADTARDTEIAWLILRPTAGTEPGRYTDGNNDERVTELYDFTKSYIQPYLDRVKGVASTDIYGGKEREVQVRVDAGQLAARGLTLGHVEQALRRQNRNISAGTRAQGKRDYAVRTVGQYQSVEDILHTVIAYTAGGPVYVRDVAEVESTFKRQTAFVRSRGEYALAFPVRREVGSNVMAVMAELREAVARVNAEVLAPRDMALELKQIYDETVYIDQAIAMVRANGLRGALLTVIVLMLFLRNWRATAAVALSIPISVIGAFVAMVALGRTLNVISLAGIAFAIGMVVDNSIVVLENIYRHRQMGKDVLTACHDGTSEVWAAVLASALTTMVVFVPVILVQEEAGQLFRDISVATVAAVGLSLIVSITVTPVLTGRLLRLGRGHHLPRPQDAPPAQSTASRWVVGSITAAITEKLGRRRAPRLVLIVVMTFGALLLARALIPPATYLPSGNRNMVFGFLITPPGYSIDEFKQMASVIERTVRPYWEAAPGSPEHRELERRWKQQVEQLIAQGAIPELAAKPGERLGLKQRLERDRLRREWLTSPPLIQDFFFVAYSGFAFMGATSRDEVRVKPLVRLLQTTSGALPGVYPFFLQTQLFREGGGNFAEVQVRGDDLEKVTGAASALFAALMERFGMPSPDPTNFALGRPEVQIESDRERAADLGLTAADVGFIVEACVDGAYVGDFRPTGSEQIDITLLVKGQRPRPTQEIGQVPIYTPAGRVVPLSAAVRMIDTTALEQIKRVERQRAVTFTVNPPETMPLEAVMRQITTEVVPGLRAAGRIDPSVTVSLTGNADKLATARNIMIGEWEGFTLRSLLNIVSSRFFLSVLICYLLIVALYESWLYPVVIMFSVPLALFGGFLGLAVCHWGTLLSTHQPVQQLDVLTFLGFVILVGTVVNNAILLVDQALQNQRLHGMAIHQAVREAVRYRTRPVLMTSLTTFFGLLPLAVWPGAGSELYRGLASVCAGGMLVAASGTLILIPAVLTTVMELRGRAAAPAPTAGARVAAAPRER